MNEKKEIEDLTMKFDASDIFNETPDIIKLLIEKRIIYVLKIIYTTVLTNNKDKKKKSSKYKIGIKLL